MDNNNDVDLIKQEFDNDTQTIGKQTDKFLEIVYPGYLLDSKKSIDAYIDNDSSLLIESMTFLRIRSCSVENTDDLFASMNNKMEKLFTALHAIDISVGYGIVSRSGVTNLVLCIYSSKDVLAVKSIVNGILSGVELDEYSPGFGENISDNMSYGILSGVPSVVLNEEKQEFNLSAIMRALNGKDYTLLFLAKPIDARIVKEQVHDLIDVRDKAFAISKRNIARNVGVTDGNTHTETTTHTKGHSDTVGGFGGVFFPPVSGGASYSHSYNRSESNGYSDAISKAVTAGKTVAADIQNGFALELMNYADKAIERLKGSQNNGVWQTAICYSADSDLSKNIIKACLSGELSKPDPDKLALLSFEPKNTSAQKHEILIPKFLQGDTGMQNPLCSYINSSELGLLCTMPTDSVPDFEIRKVKQFPLVKSTALGNNDVSIGYLVEGKRKLDNMPFALSTSDLNKHTFVCGITGSGKTTTVKKILLEAKKPFMVIESVKKEYRNMPIDTTVYTLGKPEVNCPHINPFYIMPGVSPQSHIDYLKDLFVASFSFYGPMPYILEKCLHNVYKNKGWNLTLGYHPLLANTKSSVDFFDINYMKKQYGKKSHRYLFPTMQELKDEIESYVRDEMDYEGEVAGNIKTAIKVRLENLCVGTKGYMFNTYEHLEMAELLEDNVVFELEGLADDSDKAFCVGLMIIFLNEYRQTIKESRGNQKNELNHLLVIEEAHRLLKNVDTERSSESVGNPKGKAVEHFTNMIAEMRSYGQGVIVAEQIPSKLAPDVIKNSSNKIIQRVVSADDQQLIANTIGISAEDAIQLGMLETGYALCHKEGMALPVLTKIENVHDDFVSDELLYNSTSDRISKIDLSTAREVIFNNNESKQITIGLLNSIIIEDADLVVESAKIVISKFNSILVREGITPIIGNDNTKNVVIIISDLLLSLIVRGIYAAEYLPDNSFISDIYDFLSYLDPSNVPMLKKSLSEIYDQNNIEFNKRIISELIKRKITMNTDISASIKKYFIEVSDKTVNDIIQLIKER